MNKFLYAIIFISLLILNINQSFSQNKDIFVNFINPKKESITDKIELPATIKSNEKVDITSTISEKIKEKLFVEGVSGKKDEKFVILNKF